MSTALPVSTPQSSRRIPILAAATGLVAAASIAVTIAVAGGNETTSDPYAVPAPHAHPDRARLYRYEAAQGRSEQRSSPSPADRFHHFR